jgi:hypothetical protein
VKGIGVKEKNLPRRKNDVMLDGKTRRIKNPGVVLDKSQEIFFIRIGDVFPGEQIHFVVIGLVQEGNIQRNENGQD